MLPRRQGSAAGTVPFGDMLVAMAEPSQPPFVRRYRDSDLDALYEVCLRTGDGGQDASGIYADPRLLGDTYAGAYLYLEPDLAFVLDDGGVAVGYVLGTFDTAAFVQLYRRRWVPRLGYPAPPAEPATPDEHLLATFYRPERYLVSVLEEYPAHLHIDILPPYQGRGYGHQLVERFVAATVAAGAPGVHVVVAASNTLAQQFYSHVGFQQLVVPDGRPGALYYGRKTGCYRRKTRP